MVSDWGDFELILTQLRILDDLAFGEGRERITVVLARDGPSVTHVRNGQQTQEIVYRQHDR
jgi:hypothetical protein